VLKVGFIFCDSILAASWLIERSNAVVTATMHMLAVRESSAVVTAAAQCGRATDAAGNA
jgi:hypothetical protein